MGDSIYVNFHVHSSLSDGVDSPVALAGYLADADVRYAALTDHDTLVGRTAFHDALAARGIATLPGLELTTQLEGRLVHLLAYGFDPDHAELVATLATVRGSRLPDVHSMTGSLRAASTTQEASGPGATGSAGAANGVLGTADGIALVHRAGGRAFLAHPLVLERDLGRLGTLIIRLKAMGLDGIEAVSADYSTDEQARLRAVAEDLGLLVSAGTDYHGVSGLGSQFLGVHMPLDDWRTFRAAVLSGAGSGVAVPSTGPMAPGDDGRSVSAGAIRDGRRAFALRVVLPAVAALGLFLAALWLLILPSFEATLVDRKRELIRELTNSAWSVLAAYHADETTGALAREDAQAAAAAVVGQLRYGEENLDYFWIQDTTPAMVMHPYRADLEGQDLSSYADPRGVPIFVEFAELVQAQDDGYVDYVWQWFDDPDRLEPKESYVKGFEPWGWVIGTGLYTDDVRAEIDQLEQELVLAALGVSGVIAVLLLLVLQQSLRIERRREQGVERLRDSSARYHALAEATSEGTLLVIGGRCRYANPTMLAMLGYSARQAEFLDPPDIIPRVEDNAALWAALDGEAALADVLGVPRDGLLTAASGAVIECVLTLNPVVFSGQSGFVLLARDVAGSARVGRGDVLAPGAPVGVFRARPTRRGVFTELSPVAHEIVTGSGVGTDGQAALADLFAEPSDFGRFLERLTHEGEVRDLRLDIGGPGGARSILVSASMALDPIGEPAWIDGALVDVTTVLGEAADRGLLLGQLSASPPALQLAVAEFAADAVVVGLETSLAEVARRMTEAGRTAALVSSDGAAIGIVTDRDVRARVVAAGWDTRGPVQAVMTAPLERIPPDAPAAEGLLRMEASGVRHLVVDDADGAAHRLVDMDVLRSAADPAPLALLREISIARSPDDLVRTLGRAMPLAGSLLDTSVRPRPVTALLTSVFDMATSRLFELAIAELGPPPAPFACFAMGSQGRGEVTLLSDQDSGIVYDGVAGADAHHRYFLELGRRVNDRLEAAGYARCRGAVMAGEPAWCRSRAEWAETVDRWCRRADPQDVTDLAVLFDLRLVHGDGELVAAMRRQLHAVLPEQDAALYQLARNALVFKPPMRLPGNVYLGGGADGGMIDLKDALQALVGVARIFAMRHRVSRTHTLDRVTELARRGVLPETSRPETADAYDTLMNLRLAIQLADVRTGRPPSGTLTVAELSRTRQELMRQAFGQIAELQERAHDDFPEAGS